VLNCRLIHRFHTGSFKDNVTGEDTVVGHKGHSEIRLPLCNMYIYQVLNNNLEQQSFMLQASDLAPLSSNNACVAGPRNVWKWRTDEIGEWRMAVEEALSDLKRSRDSAPYRL